VGGVWGSSAEHAKSGGVGCLKGLASSGVMRVDAACLLVVAVPFTQQGAIDIMQ